MCVSTVKTAMVSLSKLSPTVVLIFGKQSFCRAESWNCPKWKGKMKTLAMITVLFFYLLFERGNLWFQRDSIQMEWVSMAAVQWSRTLRDYNFPHCWKQRERTRNGWGYKPWKHAPSNCFLPGIFHILKVPQAPQTTPPCWEELIKYMSQCRTFPKQA